MDRSTFITLSLLTFGMILVTFIIRGSTRLVIGDRLSVWLAFPTTFLSILLLISVLLIAIGEFTGFIPLEDDL